MRLFTDFFARYGFVPCFASLPFFSLPVYAQDKAHLALDSSFGSYIEEGSPFFTQTLDARQFGEHPVANNLIPRGIIVPVGDGTDGLFGCFDPDLLRWALFWEQNSDQEYLSMVGMASGSYRLPNQKAPIGEKLGDLPQPYGRPWLAQSLAPGISSGEKPMLKDPRDRGRAEPDETGLGGLPPLLGRFLGIRLLEGGAQIEYRIASTTVRERLAIGDGDGTIIRLIQVDPRKEKLWIRSGVGDRDWLVLDPSDTPSVHQITITQGGTVTTANGGEFPAIKAPSRRWNEGVKTGAPTPPAKDAAWVYDNFPLPTTNPWKRNVRLADLEFFPDGRAACVTFDGDVWIVSGLESDNGCAWSRFASGLNEPQSIAIHDGVIYVFDRNGIVALRDTDGNGEADWYQNVSNIFAQSAETRQYAMDCIALPDGSFYLALGGQMGGTIGKLNGTVIKVAPDGDSYEVVATGFRQPYLGYNFKTGLLTASDQQGNWKPGTPIYDVEKGRYFGFQPEKFKGDVTHPAPIDLPELWIPHFVNQSGASQVWIQRTGKSPLHMAGLDEALVHIGYGRPEIFKVYLDPNHEQGAVASILSGFPTGLLNGRVNPVDGRLYLVGFQIFGSSGVQISGLFRVHPGGKTSWLPRDIRAEKRGLLLSFDQPLSPELATDLGRYSADRWNYHQTFQYGSGNYKLNDEPGQDALPVLSAKLSQDRKSIFLGIADMRPSEALRLTYRVPVPGEDDVKNVYLSVFKLGDIDLAQNGFSDNKVDLTPRADLVAATVEPSAELGRKLVIQYGCIACHATGDPDIPSPVAPATVGGGASLTVGPPWVGLWQASREFTDGTLLKKVDESYLRESILDPSRRVQNGYEMERTGVGMPSYLGVLKDFEIDSIIEYIKSIPKPTAKKQ